MSEVIILIFYLPSPLIPLLLMQLLDDYLQIQTLFFDPGRNTIGSQSQFSHQDQALLNEGLMSLNLRPDSHHKHEIHLTLFPILSNI